MTFVRATYRNKENDPRRCSTCQFSSVVKRDNAAPTMHCHRRPPLMRTNEREWRFPAVMASSHCSEWSAKVDEPRDVETGAPDRLRCAICKHSAPGAHECRLPSPAHVTHEGEAVYPAVGASKWCGEAEVEAGIENEVFIGAPPAVVLEVRSGLKIPA